VLPSIFLFFQDEEMTICRCGGKVCDHPHKDFCNHWRTAVITSIWYTASVGITIAVGYVDHPIARSLFSPLLSACLLSFHHLRFSCLGEYSKFGALLRFAIGFLFPITLLALAVMAYVLDYAWWASCLTGALYLCFSDVLCWKGQRLSEDRTSWTGSINALVRGQLTCVSMRPLLWVRFFVSTGASLMLVACLWQGSNAHWVAILVIVLACVGMQIVQAYTTAQLFWWARLAKEGRPRVRLSHTIPFPCQGIVVRLEAPEKTY
jgi:hypothetical protein